MMGIARRLALLGVVVGAVIAAVVVFGPQSLLDDDPAPPSPTQESAAASIQTLSTDFSADGNFVYDGNTTAYASVSGANAASVVTRVIDEGSSTGTGSVLWEIGFEPTVLLVGTEPSHRDLARDDVGADVLQLELNLVALGFDPDSTVTVDDTFTYNTSLMVERWQESIGAEVTGKVRQGAVVYAAPDRRVGLVNVAVGDTIADGQPILELTGAAREVTFSVTSADRDTISMGDTVTARLPDRTEVAASITSIVVTETGGAIAKAAVENPPEITADNLPATITWSNVLAADVLAVPESALLRMDSGQYFVERAGDGALVAVEPGQNSGGWVEINGELAAGDFVIAP